MVTKQILIVALLLLVGCQSVPSGDFCAIEKPDRNPVEDMTPAEARTALAKNLKGERLCGWRP